MVTIQTWKREELDNWNLVAKTILHVEEWKELFDEVGYDREWEFFCAIVIFRKIKFIQNDNITLKQTTT